MSRISYPYLRVASCIPAVRVAHPAANAEALIAMAHDAERDGADLIVFPELSVSAYTCADLFFQSALLDGCLDALRTLRDASASIRSVMVVGLPLAFGGLLLNVAAVLYRGHILGFVPKTYLPNYKEFYEQRWFSSGSDFSSDTRISFDGEDIPLSTRLLFRTAAYTFAVEICEDVWAPVPPSSCHFLAGADVVLNLSADNDVVAKQSYLTGLLSHHSAASLGGYVFSSAGHGESSTDLVFGGHAYLYENGTLLAAAPGLQIAPRYAAADFDVERLRGERLLNKTFAQSVHAHAECLAAYRTVDFAQTVSPKSDLRRDDIRPYPFVPAEADLPRRCTEILTIQALGLARRLEHTRAATAVIGISGGLDSTLALLVAVRAMDLLGWPRTRVLGVTMPGFGTTSRTHSNATTLCETLGVSFREIDITAATRVHLADLDHPESTHDVTYENAQARERTQVLMDLANQTGGLVVGTGDLSELALGWATYNGDHMSMYAVNASIPKTLIRDLIRTVISEQTADAPLRAVLADVLDTPVSPELLPATADGEIAQRTEDLVGPYDLHDFFLYYLLRYAYRPRRIFELACHAFEGRFTPEVILHWLRTFLRRFFAQQFKRSCLPDGPKVGSITLSPRGDWRMPSDADATLWLQEVGQLTPDDVA